MTETHGVVFLFDAGNTLLDNDRSQADLGNCYGPRAHKRYWEIIEKLKNELGYADYLGALELYRTPSGLGNSARYPFTLIRQPSKRHWPKHVSETVLSDFFLAHWMPIRRHQGGWYFLFA